LISVLFIAACNNSETAPSAVETIEVVSNASTSGVFPGDQVQLNATPLDLNGNTVPATLTYSSSNLAVATISSAGLITAVSGGSTTITVSAGGEVVHLTLTVDSNISDGVVVSPNTASIRVGAQQPFSFAVSTALGNPARGKSVTWSSSDLTKATVDATGKATAIAVTVGVSICAAAADAPAAVGCGTLTITP
jgi:uncharacterized protein YjdB